MFSETAYMYKHMRMMCGNNYFIMYNELQPKCHTVHNINVQTRTGDGTQRRIRKKNPIKMCFTK